MRISKPIKRAALAIGLLLLVVSAWQFVATNRQNTKTVRVLAATRDIAAGAILASNAIAWHEVGEDVAGAYLTKTPRVGSVMLITVTAGELIPSRSVGAEPFATGAVVTVKPTVMPVRTPKIGDRVDIWVQEPKSTTGETTNLLTQVAEAAQVVAVSTEQAAFGGGPKTIDLLVSRDELQGVVAATLTSQAELAIVRSNSLRDGQTVAP